MVSWLWHGWFLMVRCAHKRLLGRFFFNTFLIILESTALMNIVKIDPSSDKLLPLVCDLSLPFHALRYSVKCCVPAR